MIFSFSPCLIARSVCARTWGGIDRSISLTHSNRCFCLLDSWLMGILLCMVRKNAAPVMSYGVLMRALRSSAYVMEPEIIETSMGHNIFSLLSLIKFCNFVTHEFCVGQ
jgi:hypothetical protein